MPHFAEKKLCTGCTACVNSCPFYCLNMRKDENGFAYPFMKDSSLCINCGLCENVCPIQNDVQKSNKDVIAYAAYSNDNKLRMKSSSGGIFSEVANLILENEGAVFGAAFDSNFNVRHLKAENEETLFALRGAKYSESWLGWTFREVKRELVSGRQVLFSGTPCQVSGLKSYLSKEYENLYCIDFVCHGVPSPMVWKKYLEYRAESDDEGMMPKSVNFRDKKSGWTRYNYSCLFQYEDGMEFQEISTKNLYMKLFTGDYILRDSCERCFCKGYDRVSDMTLGDFWGIWDIAPEMDDNKGTSLVLLHTKKGTALWDMIKEHVCYKRVKVEQTSEQNPSIVFSSKHKRERAEILGRIREDGFRTSLKINTAQSALKSVIWKKLKRIIKLKKV